jgi:hypothetical protein
VHIQWEIILQHGDNENRESVSCGYGMRVEVAKRYDAMCYVRCAMMMRSAKGEINGGADNVGASRGDVAE